MADRPAHSVGRDPKGYYAALGVPVTASAERIKLAFRRKAMELHPDRNQDSGATDAFQRVNEAYRTLADPEARARYDTQAAERHAAAPSPGPAGRPRPASAEGSGQVACSRCGAVTAQPRYVVFWRVIGLVFTTRRQAVQGVFCRACADAVAWRASAVTALLGWWGLPWGPPWTLRALWRNMMGGDRPGDANAALLRQLTLHFITTGNALLARAALDQALRLVERPDLRQKIQKLRTVVGDGSRDPRLIDRWRPAASYGFWVHLVPMALSLAGLVLMLGVAAHGATGSGRAPVASPALAAAAAPPVPERWHAATGPLLVRAGPGTGHAPIGHLNRFDPVEVLERADGWVRVRTPAGQVGFVAAEYLARE